MHFNISKLAKLLFSLLEYYVSYSTENRRFLIVEDGILIVRKFDEMRRTFSEQFKNMENKVPKDLMKEYETSEGGKVRGWSTSL